MSWTRTTKNRVLAAANLLLVAVLVTKLATEPDAMTDSMRFWTVIAPIVVVIALAVPERATLAPAAHAALFLTTGMAIGVTTGVAIRSIDTLWMAEILWLPIGVAAAVVHYWPSRRDPYRGGSAG